jgi:hypothetical protein
LRTVSSSQFSFLVKPGTWNQKPGTVASSDFGFPLRLKQNLYQPIEGGVGSLVDLIQLHRADGMLHDQDWMIRSTERFAFRLGQRLERACDQGHREPAAFLDFNGVVDTPRRARSSISETADNKIRLGSKLIEVIFRSALLRRDLAPPDDAGDAEFFSEQLLEAFFQPVRVRLAVIQQADDFSM